MADNRANNPAIEGKIKTWLRQACDRDGGRSRRFEAKRRRVSSGIPDIETDTDTNSPASESDVGEDNDHDGNQ